MTGWLAETLGATGLLIGLVLWLRRPVARAFGARVAYALWALPALRLVLPPLPGVHRVVVPALVVQFPRPHAPGLVEVGLIRPETLPHGAQLLVPGLAPHGLADLHAAAAPIVAAAPPSIDLASLVFGAWIVGVTVVLAWQAWAYAAFMRKSLAGAVPIGRAAGTTILVSRHVDGPVATGVLTRRILLPEDFTRRYSRTEARLVLDHEAAHHDRGDLIANLAAILVLASQWWNPLAWWAHRVFRADQELACDATVTAGLPRHARHIYAQAVARSAGFAGPAAAAPLSAIATLKRRLAMMGREQSRMRIAAGGLLVSAVIAGALVGSASGQAADQATARHHAHAPTPPIPPQPPQAPEPPAPAPTAPQDEVPPAPSAPPAPAVAPTPPPAPTPPAPPSEADARAAELQAQAAGREAQEAGLKAQQAAMQAVSKLDIAGIVRTSIDAARAGLEAGCRERGGHPAANSDIGTLANCNAAGASAELRAGLAEARGEIAADPDFNSAEAGPALHAALAEIDRQIALLNTNGR